MSNGFTTTTTLATVNPADPTKHVNYSLGMILGVDDLTQEFAYLTGHNQWLARDALGYGTLNGLSVTGTSFPADPQLLVSAGTALMPSGKLVRVCANQCAQLVDWVAAHQTEVSAKAPSGVTNFDLQLYVVLCYSECLTDWVPVPGDPCRTEDDLQAPSRVADNFALELRLDPPQQTEQDATAHFAHWLASHVHVVPSGGSAISDFISAVRNAATPGARDAYINDDLPNPALNINVPDVPALMRAVHRLWVTELRPRWRPLWLGSGDSCSQTYVPVQPVDGDCLLLAQVTSHMVQNLAGGPWVIQWLSDADRVVIVEDAQPTNTNAEIALRPVVASTGLLRELYTRLSGGAGLTGSVAVGPLGITTQREAPSPAAPAAATPVVSACLVIAAGVVEVVATAADAARSTSNPFNLQCATATAEGVVTVTFANATKGPWVVHVTQMTDGSGRSYAFTYDEAETASTKNGFALRVKNGIGPSARDVARTTLIGIRLMVQVSRYST